MKKNLKPTNVVSAMVALAIVLSLALCACGSDSVPMIETTSSSTTTETTEVTVETTAEVTTKAVPGDICTNNGNIVCYIPDGEKGLLVLDGKANFSVAANGGISELYLVGLEAPVDDLEFIDWECLKKETVSPGIVYLKLNSYIEREADNDEYLGGGHHIMLEGEIRLYGETILKLYDGTGY